MRELVPNNQHPSHCQHPAQPYHFPQDTVWALVGVHHQVVMPNSPGTMPGPLDVARALYMGPSHESLCLMNRGQPMSTMFQQPVHYQDPRLVHLPGHPMPFLLGQPIVIPHQLPHNHPALQQNPISVSANHDESASSCPIHGHTRHQVDGQTPVGHPDNQTPNSSPIDDISQHGTPPNEEEPKEPQPEIRSRNTRKRTKRRRMDSQ